MISFKLTQQAMVLATTISSTREADYQKTQHKKTQHKKTQHRKLNTRKLNTRKLNTENSTHFKPSIIVIYSTVIKKTSPGRFQARFSRNRSRILKNIRDKSFLEFHLVYISVFKISTADNLCI